MSLIILNRALTISILSSIAASCDIFSLIASDTEISHITS